MIRIYLFLLVFLGACGTKPLYYWGHYESVIYDRLAKQGGDGPTEHIELLQKDIDYVQSRDLKHPPGFHAHLGMLYSEVGKGRLAQEHLAKEKAAFPESEHLMNRFLGKTKGKRK